MQQLTIFGDVETADEPIKKEDFLDSKFCHRNWFIQGISKRHALQYFAGTGDFQYNGNRIRYSGKEGGSYQLSKREQIFYNELLHTIQEVKTTGKIVQEKLAAEPGPEGQRKEIIYIDKGMLVTVSVNWSWITVQFIEYLENHCKKYLESQKKTKSFKNSLPPTFLQ